MSVRHAALAVCLVVLFGSVSYAGIRPSFHVDSAAWDATDIVIASLDKDAPGVVTVVDVWYGSLSPRDRLTLPELAKFAKDENHTVGNSPDGEETWMRRRVITTTALPDAETPLPGRTEKTPAVVIPCDRVLLCLKRAGTPDAGGTPPPDAGGAEKPAQARWSFAYLSAEGSVAWLAQDGVYAFHQMINPGPSILIRERLSAKELTEKVHGIIGTRKDLARIAALPEAEARAKGAVAYVDSLVVNGADEAFRILTGCGDAALPILRGILQGQIAAGEKGRAAATEARAARALGTVGTKEDIPLLRELARKGSPVSAILALAELGGRDVAQDFVEMLKSEDAFWRETAPGLDVGWWNGKGLAQGQEGPLRSRYSRTLEILYAMDKLKSPGCGDAVTEFRDYWRSLPQLEDKSGLTQMSEACDRMLKTLDEQPD